MASPFATSPPAAEIHNGGEPAMVAHFQAARPKLTALNRSQGTPRPRPNASGSNNNSAKRKRKTARPNENVYPVMNTVTTLSATATLSPTNNVATSCATGLAFSPNCMQVTNGPSPLGSAAIPPADSSTTLSPLQAPNSLDMQPPSPLGILSPDDLAGLEEEIVFFGGQLDLVDPFCEPTDMSMCELPPSTTIGQVGIMDAIVPNTSDCIYVPNNAPSVQRADPLAGQRLCSVQSKPGLHCGGLQHNGRACSSVQKASITTPSQLASSSYQAITNSNMYESGDNLIPQKECYCHNDYPIQQPLQLQNQLVLGQMPVCSLMNGSKYVSPQKHLSFHTPSPDSLGQRTSSSLSSSC